MMQVDIIVVGQGISGTFLSYYLSRERKSFVVVDNNDGNSPSRISAGIINPVTGRRMVTVWRADEVMPFAWSAYQEIGSELDIAAISQKNIIDLFPNPFMRENFLKRLNEGSQYLRSITEPDKYQGYFNYEFGCAEIQPVYTAHLETLLPAWRNKLIRGECLLEESFDIERLVVKEGSIGWSAYDGETIKANRIIFCDGAGGFDNPYFRQLPFAPNKGEALIVEIPGLPSSNIYKKSLVLAPLATENLFWLGSNYLWDFDNAEPTPEFRKNGEAILSEWLKVPFKILEHRAGIRPATVERRPFVGLHPFFSNIGILNGMGTKGCSLAPLLARQLTNHLVYGKGIIPEVDISRFKKILTK